MIAGTHFEGTQATIVRGNVLTPADLTLGMCEQIRLILRGGSVIDWYRLRFDSIEDVRGFLRVNSFDLDEPRNVERLRTVYRKANEYLSSTLSMPIARELWEPIEVEYPFIVASTNNGELQQQACILLKLVHTINHYEARALRLKVALSELEVFGLVEQRVANGMNIIRELGYPIELFKGSRKTRESTITKLLSKRRADAAVILDRLRFRVIVTNNYDIPCLLAEMNRSMLPFNYVVPEETTNDIIDFRRFFESLDHLQRFKNELQFDLELEAVDPLRREFNECSADDFRMLNFVVDFPISIHHIMDREENAHLRHLGHIVFLNVEFQIFDKATWDQNEANPGTSHEAYKERQRERVRDRLLYGLEPHNNARKENGGS